MLNALTIDVEDYFHVSGFDGCVSRSQWDDFASRVEDSTRRILDRLAEAGVQATFFVLGWVAERQPELVRAIHDGRSRDRLSQLLAPADLPADAARSFAPTCVAAATCWRTSSASRCRPIGAELLDHAAISLWALDVLLEEGFRFDSSIYPTHHDRYGIPGTPLEPHRIEPAGGNFWEFPPPVWRLLGYPLAGRRRRLFPALSLCPDARGLRRDQRGGPAIRRLPASVGTRPRSAAL